LEAEEAVSLIQSSLQGHFARQQFMNSQATTAGHGPTPGAASLIVLRLIFVKRAV